MASVCAVVGCGPGMGGSAAVRFARAGYKIAGMCRTADSFLPTEDGVANSTQSCKMCLGFCKTPIDGSQPHPRGDTFVKNRFCQHIVAVFFTLMLQCFILWRLIFCCLRLVEREEKLKAMGASYGFYEVNATDKSSVLSAFSRAAKELAKAHDTNDTNVLQKRRTLHKRSQGMRYHEVR